MSKASSFINFVRAGAALLVLSLSAAMAVAQDAPRTIPGVRSLDAKGVIDLITGGKQLVILDNRNSADFDRGRLEGAVRLIDTDITGPEVMARVAPAKDTALLFYCNGLKCGRAAKAAEKAVSWNYSQVYYYAEGLEDWRKLRLPIVTQ